MVKNLLCLAGGVAIGYYVAHSRLEKTFHERLKKETDDAKEFFRLKYAKKAAADYVNDEEFMKEAIRAADALSAYVGVPVDATALVEDLSEAVERDQPDIPEDEPTDSEGDPGEEYWENWKKEHEADKAAEESKPAPPVVVVPEQAVGAVNYNRISTDAVKKEDPAEAKVEFTVVPIDQEEYDGNAFGFEQTTVTYFAGDDRLANMHDQVITEDAREKFLGAEIFELLKTPEARGGQDTVYARNVPRRREFEIIISPGNYTDEVGEVVYATG